MSLLTVARLRAPRHGLTSLIIVATSWFLGMGAAIAATSPAPVVTPEQLTITAANAAGDAIYNLALTPGKTGALITATHALNTDGSKHGSFDALVWSPNSVTGTLDLIVADATKGQILKYAGPSYGTSSVLFAYSGKGSGPAYPAGLAVDGAGNLFAISPSSSLSASPALWVLPFNKTTGGYGAPVLIDQSFGGSLTLALAEVLVAGSSATAVGTAAPAWSAGDVLVLVGDTFDSRVIVYSHAAIAGVLGNPKLPLKGPSATVVTSRQFLSLIAAPFGMDIWPADATHGASLLFTTIDGRIIRFDSKQNAFTTNFASGLGLGLTKLKVGTYAGVPYAFVAQVQLPTKGKILQLGAPPVSGANKVLASVSSGVSDPIGIALSSSGSTPINACVAPNTCMPVGAQETVQITGPGAANIPPGATILQTTCTVPSDPRVAIVNNVWSCLGSTINVCGATPTPGCVPATLDVANYCPGFPSTILPPTMCGHSGASGAAFQVIKSTAQLLDQNANDIYINTAIDATVSLPGPYDLGCQVGTGQFGPLIAWAPRSDLPTVEGTIPEDANSPFFTELTGYCDKSGVINHVESMFAFGLGLNAGANGLGTGPTAGLFGFVTAKFNNLSTIVQEEAPQTTPAVTTVLENYVTQSQAYFNSDFQNDVNDYSCALNSIASADVYLRNQANTNGVFTYHAPAVGNNNPNPAGEVDSRLANLYLTIAGDFTATPNPSWPTVAVPPCVTLSLTTNNAAVSVGSSATLSFGPPTPQFANTPLLFAPSQCTLSASDGTFKTPMTVAPSGSVSTGTLTQAGTYTATLECAGVATDTSTSFATTSVPVSSAPPPPTLTTVVVQPVTASAAAGQTVGFTASGINSAQQPITLTGVSWSTSNGVATVDGNGLATCLQAGVSNITATSSPSTGSVAGSASLTCSGAVLTGISVSPNPASVPAGLSQQFMATGVNSLNQPVTLTQVNWSSAATAIATVNSGGLATCAQFGSTLITATSGNFSGAANLNCTPPTLAFITVMPTSATVQTGSSQQFTVSGTDTVGNAASAGPVTWSSGNPAVATVDTNGLATCVQNGGTNITATNTGNLTSSGTLICNPATPVINMTASPASVPINNITTLNWTSNLPAGDSCTLTSPQDPHVNGSGLPANGSAIVEFGTPGYVTYVLNCTGPVNGSAQTQVLYTQTTTYHYTGMPFYQGATFGEYTPGERVTATITVSVPFGPNRAPFNPTTLPGFSMTMNDGVQTLTQGSGGVTSNGIVSTDGNGNILTWSFTNDAPQEVNEISTDYQGPSSAVDFGYKNNNDGQQICTAGDCASIADTPGTWTTTTGP
jgi:hypothetical protein